MNTQPGTVAFHSVAIGGLVAIGVAADCCTTGGYFTAVATAAGGLGGNLAAEAFKNLHAGYRRYLSGPQGLIANHDLRRAVATTVGQCILLAADEADGKTDAPSAKTWLARARAWASEATDWLKALNLRKPTHADRLRTLADSVTKTWDSLAEQSDFAALSEAALNDVFAVLPADISRVQPIAKSKWMELLIAVAGPPDSPHRPSAALLEIAASRLESHFIRMLREVLKEDFETGGKAFAALHMNVLGELLFNSRSVLRVVTGSDKKLDLLIDLVRGLAAGVSAKAAPFAAQLAPEAAFRVKAELAELRPVDISRITDYAPADLIGRETETALLSDAWRKTVAGETGRAHVLTFVALGGEGKTALVARWAADLAGQDWPGCDGVFAWTFYSQGTREQHAASSDLFLKAALDFFGDAADKELAASNAGQHEKGQRLAQIVGRRRSLLILDGLEPLQYAPTSPTPGELKDQGVIALLKGLATTSHGLCIVTTRYSIPNLRAFRRTTAPEVPLPRLSRAAGVHLLQTLGVKGSLRRNIPSTDGKEQLNEYEKLVEDVKGHALTLNLLGTWLRDAHNGDIRKRDLVKLEQADAEEQDGHAFRVLDAYVEWLSTGGKDAKENERGLRALAILRLLGLFDRPATADCLNALWRGDAIAGLTEPLVGLSDAQRNVVLKHLEDAKLLTLNRDPGSAELVSLDAHPLLREYFARRVREQHPEAWRAAHRRLYEHLCKTTSDRKPEPTLEDLQPLYQAVTHGCHCAQYQASIATYKDRILRGTDHDGFYSLARLGAVGSDLGVVACFFEAVWDTVTTLLSEFDRGWLLNQAASLLRSVGRLHEARDLQSAALKGIDSIDRRNAAQSAANMSELELLCGNAKEALSHAHIALSYARKSGNPEQQELRLATLGNALFLMGDLEAAGTAFRDSEEAQARRDPAHPLLFSLRGFNYCKLLLHYATRATWLRVLGDPNARLEALDACTAAKGRATRVLAWADSFRKKQDRWLAQLCYFDALFHESVLSCGRQRLPVGDAIDHAINGLRANNVCEHVVDALLIRARFRRLIGPVTGPDSAQSDLDEAWEIAERGPMRLHMADIHLYRARLFWNVTPYPWAVDPADERPDAPPRTAKDDLAAARKLIEQCGYGRRKEELEDAEEAAKAW